MSSSHWVIPSEVVLNFAYGWNTYGLDGQDRPLAKMRSLVPSYVKMNLVVSPSDCVSLGDTAG